MARQLEARLFASLPKWTKRLTPLTYHVNIHEHVGIGKTEALWAKTEQYWKEPINVFSLEVPVFPNPFLREQLSWSPMVLEAAMDSISTDIITTSIPSIDKVEPKKLKFRNRKSSCSDQSNSVPAENANQVASTGLLSSDGSRDRDDSTDPGDTAESPTKFDLNSESQVNESSSTGGWWNSKLLWGSGAIVLATFLVIKLKK